MDFFRNINPKMDGVEERKKNEPFYTENLFFLYSLIKYYFSLNNLRVEY